MGFKSPPGHHFLQGFFDVATLQIRRVVPNVVPATTEYFQIRGLTEPADLKVVTVAEGGDADVLRQIFATTKLNEIEQNYTHFYSSLYTGVKMTSPIVVEDDEDQNRFQTTETYSIDKVWTMDQDRKYECSFYPSTMDALLKKPVNEERSQPLAILFPEHQILRTEVTLPYNWPEGASDKTISDAAFSFRKVARCVGNKLVMEYEYQTLADSVSPDQVSDYIEKLDESSRILGDMLVWP